MPMGDAKASTTSLLIRIWPDNTWAPVDDIRDGEFAWKSDDYSDVDINDPEALTKLDKALVEEILEGIS